MKGVGNLGGWELKGGGIGNLEVRGWYSRGEWCL